MSFFSSLKLIIILCWLVATGWLIRFEAFPHWFEDTVQGYSALAEDLPAIRDSWMKVMSEGRHVGYVHSSTQMEEVDGMEQVFMGTEMLVHLSIGKGEEELEVELEADHVVRLNSRLELLSSTLSGSLGDMISGSIVTTPVEGKKDRYDIQVTVDLQGMQDIGFRRQVTLPDDVVVSSPLLDTGLRSLKPGETMRIRTVNPFLLSGDTKTVVLQGEKAERDSMFVNGTKVKISRVSMTMDDIKLYALVDEYGRIVKQQTPFNVYLVLSDAQTAVDMSPDSRLDLLELISDSPLSKIPIPL